jgi:tetratricopeptide (TPR) repeat protein
MSDQEKLEEIKRIYSNAKPFGFRVWETLLPIIESLEDRRDRDSYICLSAEWLATGGDLSDLDHALVLVRSSNLLTARYSALIAIASRFFHEGHRQRALDLLAEAEATSLELERNEEYTALEKASAWDQIADIYYELGELTSSKRAWAKAVSLAQIGQQDPRQQEVHDNIYLLFTLAKKLALNGYLEDAIKAAQSIKMDSWRQSALKELRNLK